MSAPIRAGDDERPFEALGWPETLLLLTVIAGAAVVIGLLVSVMWLAQSIAGIANDPNAGPYRQVR